MKQVPDAYVMSMAGLDHLLNGTKEIVIVGEKIEGNNNEYVKALRKKYYPENLIIYLNPKNR